MPRGSRRIAGRRTAARRPPGSDSPAMPAAVAAVIELGTTSIRMAIAQRTDGEIRSLESLQQAITIGRDTFTGGFISRATTEACVEAIQRFVRVAAEYGIGRDHMRVAATSAVREAANRDVFLDRIAVATGVQIEVLDEADVNRLNYLAAAPLLRDRTLVKKHGLLVAEVGGGNTETLLFSRQGAILSAHTHRIGSLRLPQMLQEERLPATHVLAAMRTHIDRAVREILERHREAQHPAMLALGGDIRFAATVLAPDNNRHGLARLPVAALGRLCRKTLACTADELVRAHHLSYPDAETLGPALLLYWRLAEAFGQDELLVGASTLRDGMLTELLLGSTWNTQFTLHVLNSAREIGRRYHFDEVHARQVADIATAMFDLLREEHALGTRERVLLQVAALLHDIGDFVASTSHHKHSLYLIQHSEIFGLNRRDTLLTAVVARYHRRALPSRDHEEYRGLDPAERLVVAKLAAILRVADALDRSHQHVLSPIAFGREPGRLLVEVARGRDLTLEQRGLREKAGLLEQVFGLDTVLRCAGSEPQS